jgi:flagellar basal body rod protein FlgB
MTVPTVSMIEQVSAAMSTASLRHQVIASNIANRDSQEYQRLQLQFERALDGAQTASVAAETTAAPLSLEQDMVALSSNAAHYGALARILTRYFSIVEAITNHNRG